MTQNKRKILYIVTQAELGGAQKYVFDLATHLADEFEITVAAGADGSSRELLDKLADAGIKNLTFKHLKRNINLWNDILAVFEIAKFLRQNNFDIIHLNSTKAGVIGALATELERFFAPLRMTKTKIIYTAHGWVYLEPLTFYQHWLYLIMEKIAARLRDHTIVLSEKEKQIALQYGTAKPNAVSVIPNGIDLNNLQFLSKNEARQKLNLSSDKFIIGTIANLYKTKGLEYLIEAVKTLTDVQTVIIGEGSERKNIEEKIKQNKLEKQVTLCGSIAQAYQYLPAFDIFVLPSIKEGFPNTLLEAMAAGLPIIATDVGAIPEILENDKDGLIVASADSLVLKQAIAQLINNPEYARRLGIDAKEKIKQFDLHAMIEKTKRIYTGFPPPRE
ncbi:MAG: glycosyltransferase family 4 protein [Patescibacteria group bacterium]